MREIRSLRQPGDGGPHPAASDTCITGSPAAHTHVSYHLLSLSPPSPVGERTAFDTQKKTNNRPGVRNPRGVCLCAPPIHSTVLVAFCRQKKKQRRVARRPDPTREQESDTLIVVPASLVVAPLVVAPAATGRGGASAGCRRALRWVIDSLAALALRLA